jgi:hypothetical protein
MEQEPSSTQQEYQTQSSGEAVSSRGPGNAVLFEADFDQRRFDEAVTRAYVDYDFRERLIADPKATFRDQGVVFPDHVQVIVHEFDPNVRHLFLPPRGGPIIPPRSYVGERPPQAPPDDPVPAGVVRFGVVRPFLSPSEGGVQSEEGGEYG